jgi:hypothetical protein
MLALDPNAQVLSSPKSAWPHLDAEEVIARLLVLMKYPNMINQGALGLCGEATFFHHVLQRDPYQVFATALDLLNNGVGKLGDLKITPHKRLRHANYPKNKAAYVPQGEHKTPYPPQADWMLLTALRDTFNTFHHYEGRPEQSMAESSTAEERVKWYDQCGLYIRSEIHPVDPGPLDTIEVIKKALEKTNTNHISLNIKQAMIRAGKRNHTISLESEIDVINNSVKFQYWSWGFDNFDCNYFLTPTHDPTPFMTVKKFMDNFLSAIIAPY